jgi:hypothetical protein
MVRFVKLNPINIKIYWKFLIHLFLSFLPLNLRKRFFLLMRLINKDFYWIYPG